MNIGAFRKAAWTVRFRQATAAIFRRNADGQRAAVGLSDLEHGLAPEEKAARLQNRLTPLQRRIFGSCHLNRPIDQLVAGAGLELTQMKAYYLMVLRAFVYTFEGGQPSESRQ